VRRWLGIALLIFAALQYGYRGAERVRAEVPLWDFASVYAAARTWIHGGNPYDLPGVLATWHACGVFSDRDVSYFATVYPPSSLCMLMPFALLPGSFAMQSWLALTLVLIALQFAALVDLAGLRFGDPRTLILVAAGLASAPFQFGILSGQLSMPAISACVIAFWLASRQREMWAGVVLGLACALKPQVAAPFVLYYLMLRRWSVGGMAVIVGGTVMSVAVLAMRISHLDWLAGWKHSIALTTQIGAVNDYGWSNTLRDEIMDLKMLLVSIVHNPALLRVGVDAVVVVLGLCYLRAFRWGGVGKRDGLLAVAGLTAISLLPIYHRVYDAALLTTALAWALAELDGPRRRYAIAMLVPMALFLVPFDFTATVGRRVHLVDAISQTGWWQTLFAPHYAWGLLFLTTAIVVTMSRIFSRSAMPATATSPAEPRFPMPRES
jgi:hypothetical protein